MKHPPLNILACRAGKFSTCLILGVASLIQTARSAPNYGTAALSENPLAFWQLNETGFPSTGTLQAYDSTGNGYNGTYGIDSFNVNNGIYAPQPPTYLGFTNGQGAVYVSASDVNSPVTLPLLNLNTNAVTITMWINPASGEVANTGLLINRTPAGDAAGFGFGTTLNGNGMAELGYIWNTNSSATTGFESGLYPVSAIYQFVALVVNSNSATIYLYYIDSTGQAVLESSVNAIAHTPESFSSGVTYIGSDVVNGNAPDSTRVFNGQIASVAVYKSALTPVQILTLFAAGVGVNGFAPTITAQPNSQSVLLNSQVQLSATGIGGTTPITYKWQLNNTDVSSLPDSANFTGANSNVLTVLNVSASDTGSYHLILNNSIGQTTSSNATITIQSPALVGQWFDGSSASTNLVDVSGYSLAANHDAYTVGSGNYMFTNDVPPGKTGYSLLLWDGASGMAISNSSTLDANYDNTFDQGINHAMTVAYWAKGWPTTWSPWVSKFGDFVTYPDYHTTSGWQLRSYGSGPFACFSLRDLNVGVSSLGLISGDDMGASQNPTEDGNWHFYVGTFDAGTGVRNLYVDGVLAAQNTNDVAYILAPEVHLCIGAKDSPPGNSFGNFSTNEIYDVRIYNYALTQGTVLQMYGSVPIAIGTQPQPVKAFLDRTANFSVTASGTPPLGFQWQLNGTDVNLLADATNFTGANSTKLSILSVSANDVGLYSVIVTNSTGSMLISSNAALTLIPQNTVGQWFTNASLADVSGYQPAGTHDGIAIGDGIYVFTNDVPPGRNGNSLYLDGSGGIAINNSSTLDANYTNTFDDTINGAMTVAFWAKGWPGGWNPWVSKYGESTAPAGGWQLRTDGSTDANNIANQSPCWTIRGNAGTVTLGTAVYGSAEDNSAYPNSITDNDGQWHCYVGTYSAASGLRSLYVDGQLVAHETGQGLYTMAPEVHVCIGAKDSPPGATYGNYFQGEIYDVNICNYDWSSNQVAQFSAEPDPSIGGQPSQSITAYVGTTRTISVTGIKGTATITNQWQLNNINLVDGNYGGAIISGATSSILTISDVTTNVQGVYHLVVSNPKGTLISSNVTLTVAATVPPPAANLVGEWLAGATNLTDTSGYSPAGTHDGYGDNAGGPTTSGYVFTTDVPSGQPGQSLSLNGTVGIVITNSSTGDAGYTDTFDDGLTNAMTVLCWAKGVPGSWNPWVSKYGETEAGWQLRVNASSDPTWSMRGSGGVDDMAGGTATEGSNWHLYAGTFDQATGVRNLYVDGVLAATEITTLPYTLASSYYLCIGAKDSGGPSFGNFFQGEIYGVRIYNTALSVAQVNSFLVSTAPQAPAFSGPPVLHGNNLVLTWDSGTLLQATNVAGPWTSTKATSPYTNNVTTAPMMFFRLSNP